MAKKYRVYEVQIPGQITRMIACDDMEEQDGKLVFIADGITLFEVEKETVRWWQVTPKVARTAGVRRSKSLSRVTWLLQAGSRFGSHGQ